VEGCTLKDQIVNTLIRNDLNIFNLNNRVQNNWLDWVNRVERIGPELIAEYTYLMDYIPR
jgi:hypothetical protein